METIPLIAYGTYIDNPMEIANIYGRIEKAINIGYNHIDTAYNYNTEGFVIDAVSNISRDSIFITSKIQNLISSDAIKKNLRTLEYYDLLLLHYPPLNERNRGNFKNKLRSMWKTMNKYIEDGVTRYIGISNFYKNHLDILLEICVEENLIAPLINQIEIHPGNVELEYVSYMKDRDIIPFAHTPLGGMASVSLLSNEKLIDIGRRIRATPAQVILAYLLRRGIGVVTTSKDEKHMEESLHAGEYISLLNNDDINIINDTEIGLGPMTIWSARAYEHNMLF